MCRHGGLLIAYDDKSKKALVTDADCECWRCPECAAMLGLRYSATARLGVNTFIQAGRPMRFVTVTSHERLRTFAACAAVWPAAWSKLYARLKRQADGRLDYFIVPERHKDGRMHVHMLMTVSLTSRWFKDNARQCGLGFQADSKPLTSGNLAARYVTKYLTKGVTHSQEIFPPRFRRVRMSRTWPALEAPETELSDLHWQHVLTNAELRQVYTLCDARGYWLIDARTGESFDDVDLDEGKFEALKARYRAEVDSVHNQA